MVRLKNILKNIFVLNLVFMYEYLNYSRENERYNNLKNILNILKWIFFYMLRFY